MVDGRIVGLVTCGPAESVASEGAYLRPTADRESLGWQQYLPVGVYGVGGQASVISTTSTAPRCAWVAFAKGRSGGVIDSPTRVS